MYLEFKTFEEADRYLRHEGYSAVSIASEDHYAYYTKGSRKAEIGPGSISGPDGNWRIDFD